MNRFLCAASILVASAACSGTEPPTTQGLSAANKYTGLGVARLFPDGLTPMALVTFSLTIDNFQASGGRAVASLASARSGPIDDVPGTFETEGGRFQFEPINLSVTSSLTEVVIVGGRVDDGRPADGVGSEIVGFIRTEADGAMLDGDWFGLADEAGHPAAPASSPTVTGLGDGTVALEAAPNSVSPGAGIEVFRFSVSRDNPEFSSYQAAPDGGFRLQVAGIDEDRYVVRVRIAGVASAAVIAGE